MRKHNFFLGWYVIRPGLVVKFRHKNWHWFRYHTEPHLRSWHVGFIRLVSIKL